MLRLLLLRLKMVNYAKIREEVEAAKKIAYIHGKCFICGGVCENFAHGECCIAYTDDIEKRVKGIYEEYDK